MAKIFLILCISIVIASTYVSPFHIKPTKPMSIPSALLDNLVTQNSKDTHSISDVYQDRIAQGPSNKTHEVENDEDRPKIQRLESCKSSIYCEKVINYPQAAVEKFKTKFEILGFKFDSLDLPTFAQRTNEIDYIKLCDASDKVMYREHGKDRENNYHFVFNDQPFNVQVCEETDCNCNPIIIAFAENYRGRCKQFFSYIPARAFTKKGDQIDETYTVEIEVPSHCACIAEPL